MIEQYYPTYRGVTWEKLKGFLQTLFPDVTKFRERRADDKWVFSVPRELTQEEREKMDQLRDQGGESEKPRGQPEQ